MTRTCALFEGGPGRPAVLFVGDSHAGVLKPEMREMGRRHDVTVLLKVRNCDAGRYGETAFCSEAIRGAVADEARRRGVTAVAALSYWDEGLFDTRSLARDVAVLGETQARFIVETVPFHPSYDPVLRLAAYQGGAALDTQGMSVAELDAAQGGLANTLGEAAREADARLLRPRDHLCGPERCDYVEDGKLLYFDSNHLTLAGARRLRPLLDEIARGATAHNM